MSTAHPLKEKAKNIPNEPGVYLFLNEKGKPLYIGRAGSLKKRIASYFLKNRGERTAEMVTEARDLDYEITDTLLEAIVLEANLIKKYWPKYNVRDKDNRSFVYLVIPKKQDFPAPLIVRGQELRKYPAKDAYIYGPYQAYHLLKTALQLVRKIFPYCTEAQKRKKVRRPCFHYQIGQCPGACLGEVSKTEYKENMRNLRMFFAGDKKRLHKRLQKNNPEKEAALKHVQDIALLSDSRIMHSDRGRQEFQRIEGYDISHLAGSEPVGAMVVFEYGERNPAEYRLFKIMNKDEKGRNYSDTDMLKEVLERRLKHKEWPYPDIVFVDGGLAQVRAMHGVLTTHNVHIPVVGLAKRGGHSASAAPQDRLVVTGVKPQVRSLIKQNKKLFQAVRNEAHRFVITFGRKRQRKSR